MSKKLPAKRSNVKLSPPRQSRRMLGLVSRLLPVVVLMIGLTCWMTMVQNARAQVAPGQGGYGNQYNNQYGRGFPNGANGQPGGTAQPNSLQPNRQQYSNTPGQPDYRMAAGGGGIPVLNPAPTATEALGGEAEEPAEAASWFQTPAILTKVMSGGWLMLPLAICSFVVITLSMERMIALRRGRVIPKPFVSRFTECVEDGVLSYDEATELCKEFDCPVSEVFRAALRRWGRPMFEVEQAVMDAGDRVSEGLKKYLRVFHAISNVAPLIGLLGTVIGMIEAFEVISNTQVAGGPDMLASGISTALMTTAGGLTVAIPAYLAYMYFSSKSDRYLGEIERLCQRVIDCISAEGLEENTSSTRTKKRKAA